MDDKRQKIQVELAFRAEQRGEALRHANKGTESSAAEHATESPASYEKK